MMSTTQEQVINHAVHAESSDKMKAFEKLEQLRGGFPVDFDSNKELAEAREVKYGGYSSRKR